MSVGQGSREVPSASRSIGRPQGHRSREGGCCCPAADREREARGGCVQLPLPTKKSKFAQYADAQVVLHRLRLRIEKLQSGSVLYIRPLSKAYRRICGHHCRAYPADEAVVHIHGNPRHIGQRGGLSAPTPRFNQQECLICIGVPKADAS